METKIIELNNTKFTLQKMDAIEQMGMASILLPILHDAGAIYKDKGDNTQTEEMIGGLITLLQKTDTEKLQDIMRKFLSKTYIGNICVINSKGGIVQPELVPLDVALQLVKEHFFLNFENYLKLIQ